MVKVGFHVSIAGSVDKAVDRAVAGGCDTFQIFSRNPRGWRIKELTPTEIELFIEKVKESRIYPPVDHMPYLPNLASPEEDVYRRSVDALITELERCGMLEIPYLVTHLGSHKGSGLENGYRRVADAINTAFSRVDNDVILLLENTAGTKNSVGGAFEDISAIMDLIDRIDRIGVCFDTCHAFVAGYEIRTREGLDATLKHFDEVIGLSQLKLLHINDTKGDLGSRLDRHEHIGLGMIGEDGFRVILRDPRLRDLPMILETPVDQRRGDLDNIRKVRELAD
ncbi:MAG TPA: deoxyribonuclease IV [Candidatus Syntrophoarchaeum butanivorans]|uniref:Probable endonuclease 4 n=3 Tax=Candidatus Syntropharchaeum TaxID=1912923 RepID=A0A1F2P7W4_9EURY|nr:MAG: endonuclease IV [Candidatus Syntrophoarchaeum caldarius]RJS72477.1 MAG: deoxyribonuclease IV [Candidatus Syntrophoarchaeum sp. WYZ-LMO15]HEC56423.1 deoxyribonuclease IV [Candidatus Syntrophoarchaeum butanivorans]